VVRELGLERRETVWFLSLTRFGNNNTAKLVREEQIALTSVDDLLRLNVIFS